MNRYDPRTPRALIGLAAAAMATATFAISILLPAATDYVTQDADVITQTQVATCASDGVVTAIDVIAVRSAHVVPIVQSRAAAKDGLPG
jgi:hypothetical protein